MELRLEAVNRYCFETHFTGLILGCRISIASYFRAKYILFVKLISIERLKKPQLLFSKRSVLVARHLHMH